MIANDITVIQGIAAVDIVETALLLEKARAELADFEARRNELIVKVNRLKAQLAQERKLIDDILECGREAYLDERGFGGKSGGMRP